jgi:hypothetical protein
MIAAVDTGALVELISVATLAGVAVTGCFSLVILGATRATDCQRSQRPAAAAAYAALSLVALALSLGGVVFGVSVIVAS